MGARPSAAVAHPRAAEPAQGGAASEDEMRLPAAAAGSVDAAGVDTIDSVDAGAEIGDGDWLQRIQSQWELVKKVCRQKKRTVAALLHSARPIMVAPGGGTLEIVLQADYEFHLNKLREPASRADVEWALAQVLERPCHIRLVLAGSGGGGQSGAPAPTNPRGAAPGPAAAPGTRQPAAPPAPGAASRHPDPDPRASTASHASSAHGNGYASVAAANGSSNGHVAHLVPGDHVVGGNGNGNSNGARQRQPGAARNGIHDGGRSAAQPYSAGADARVGTGAAGAPEGAGTPAQDPELLRAMEAEARADPLIREIMRAFPADLIDVRPLDPASND
jgi:hypothetical protein